jgi:hypothetical protein
LEVIMDGDKDDKSILEKFPDAAKRLLRAI